MDYFQQYELMKKFRKSVPINSIWRNKNINFKEFRYKVIAMYLSDIYYEGQVFIRYEMTNIDDPYFFNTGNCTFLEFTNSLERLTQ